MYVLRLLTDCEDCHSWWRSRFWGFQHKYSSPRTKTSFWLLSIELKVYFWSGSEIFLYKEELVSWDYDRAGMVYYCDTCVIITDHLESVTPWPRDCVTAWHDAVTLSTAGWGWLILCLSRLWARWRWRHMHSRVIKQSDVACFVCVLNISSLFPFCLLVDRAPMYIYA